MYGKQLRIFLPAGMPSGVKYAELIGWTGQICACPKGLVSELEGWRDETDKPGVYVLVGVSKSGEKLAYIGQTGGSVLGRVFRHLRKPAFEISDILTFTCKDDYLTKGHTEFLEQRLFERAKEANRLKIQDGCKPAKKALSKAERATMDEFLDNIYLVSATLGFDIFKLSIEPKLSRLRFRLMLQDGLRANGYPVPSGFKVLQGSQAIKDDTMSLKGGYEEMKKKLINDGVLREKNDKYIFTKNHTFSSSTAAVNVISGNSRSGPASWQTEGGKSLAEFEAEKAAKLKG